MTITLKISPGDSVDPELKSELAARFPDRAFIPSDCTYTVVLNDATDTEYQEIIEWYLSKNPKIFGSLVDYTIK